MWAADCSARTCPMDKAWADKAYADDTAHSPIECSGAGTCERGAGVCTVGGAALGFARMLGWDPSGACVLFVRALHAARRQPPTAPPPTRPRAHRSPAPRHHHPTSAFLGTRARRASAPGAPTTARCKGNVSLWLTRASSREPTTTSTHSHRAAGATASDRYTRTGCVVNVLHAPARSFAACFGPIVSFQLPPYAPRGRGPHDPAHSLARSLAAPP